MTILKDMLISPEEKKESSVFSHVDDKPSYPYSLKLHLEPDVVDKLGLDRVPEVGTKAHVIAVGEVVGVRKEEGRGDVERHSIELQLQHIDVKLEPREKEISKALYPGDEY